MANSELLKIDAPMSVEAEMAVLGSVFVNPDALTDLAAMPLTPNDFFLLKHGAIWKACLQLHNRRSAVDVLTVAEEMPDSDLNSIGGMAYLTHLLNSTPSSVHVMFYAEIVKRAAIRRGLMVASDHIKAWARDESIDTETVMGRALAAVTALNPTDTRRVKTLEQALDEQIAMVLDFIDNPQKPRPGLLSSIPTMNRVIGGWLSGDLIIFAARTGEGKSAHLFAETLEMAKHGAVGYFSLEMSAEKMAMRAVQVLTGISPNRELINAVSPSPRAVSAYIEGIQKARAWSRNVILEDAPTLTPAQFLSKARRMQAEYGCVAFSVDYVQRLSGSIKRKDGSRESEVREIAEGLKAAAMELNVPVLSAAQLNRDAANGRPKLSHIRESDAIAHNADVIALLYRPDYREDEREKQDNEAAEIIIAKNRDGEQRNIPVWWRPKNVSFGDRAEGKVLQPSYIKKGDWNEHQ